MAFQAIYQSIFTSSQADSNNADNDIDASDSNSAPATAGPGYIPKAQRKFAGTISPNDPEDNYGFGKNVVVSKLLIHPIKSCRGTSLQHVKYTKEGFENDRKFCIIDVEKKVVLTARDVAKMVLISPTVDEEQGIMTVEFPEDSGCKTLRVPLTPQKEWDLIDGIKLWSASVDGYICRGISPSDPSPSQELSKYCGKPVNLVLKGPTPRPCQSTTLFPGLDTMATTGYADGYPFLILGEESVESVEEELRVHVGTQGIEERWKEDKLVIERFRPNIVVKGAGAFGEDVWTEIGIGSDVDAASKAPGILLVKMCDRCTLPNVDPTNGVADKAVPLKVLMKCRTGLDPKKRWAAFLGNNGVPLGEGEIKVGDVVRVKKVMVE